MALKYRMRAFRIDTLNLLRFGSSAPRYAEEVWIDPLQCSRYIEATDIAHRMGTGSRQLSGRVIRDWPEDLVKSLDHHPKLTYCWAHWRDGKTWEEAGAIEFMVSQIQASPTGVVDQCRTRADVIRRFETLDQIWNKSRRQGYLASHSQLDANNFREVGGVLMHLGPGGEPIFSGAGCHRFAIAMLLDSPFPAQLGCVHISAIPVLQRLRSNS